MSKKIACIFPGQGSQHLGMLSEFADSYSEIKTTFDAASSVLGYDLWELCQDGPESKLNQTQVTQPALLTAEVALFRVLQSQIGELPVVMAGHSLGEYSALVAAGVIEFSEAVALVAARGEYMQQAVPEGAGAMSAILGLDDEKVIACCEKVSAAGVVAPVNFNAPGQVVIAGERAAVEEAQAACKEAGAKKAMPLPVSVPSHCELMKPASQALADKLASIPFSAANTPVINNVDVAVVEDADAIKEALVRQLYSPVRWRECVEKLSQFDVEICLECGPGKVLTGLNKRINKQLKTAALGDRKSFDEVIAALN